MYYYIEGKAIRLDLYTRCLSVHAVVLLANNKQARSRIQPNKVFLEGFPFCSVSRAPSFSCSQETAKLATWTKRSSICQSAVRYSFSHNRKMKYSLVGLCLTDNRVYYYSDASLRKTGQTDIVPSVYCIILIVFK